MQPIPEDILAQFNAVLAQKTVSSSLQDEYRKWLKYYLDFRVKYPPPDNKSEQVRLFIEKMRSKGKSGKDLHHVAHALIFTHCVPSKTLKEMMSLLDYLVDMALPQLSCCVKNRGRQIAVLYQLHFK
jgi:hypothetical protein